MALTDVQLAALDLLIAQKRADPDFIDAVNNLEHVQQNVNDLAMVAAEMAAYGSHAASAAALSDAEKKQRFATGISLDDLLRIRKEALESK